MNLPRTQIVVNPPCFVVQNRPAHRHTRGRIAPRSAHGRNFLAIANVGRLYGTPEGFIGCMINDMGVHPLIVSAAGEIADIWMNADVVQHPNGRIKALRSLQCWRSVDDWRTVGADRSAKIAHGEIE